ncbi:Plasmodium exported protein (PHISTa), unknown function [Plasmodium sp. gorilla clade G2]|uniref:Plasmodium exported protein (PHISTa), unknown function n=1 Tax=Plasmodium sp. gorilla clade G2 TaxID=880535 RepID=UPI000D2885A0|nr:Plasmodium exported protein (PHISTa), unknown function [Plasmodium sp. gorilla clade G2]SOV20374.1 Plasmodium exported protein (PHISTa), unknown function [Plasmodium sp. gorilla clade G2]
MASKKVFSFYPIYSFDENQKRKLHYISFKLLFLSLYIIGFYYVFLNNSFENSSLEIAKNGNVYIRNLVEAERNNKRSKRKQNSKLKKEDVSKTKSNENNNKCDEQKVEENKHITNNDNENNHVENKSNISISNINYNDISKRLSEKELFEVLNSFEECPSNEDLRYIWSHTMGVAKEVLDNVFKESQASIQKYLDNDILKSTDSYGFKYFVYDEMWKDYIYRFSKEVAIEEVEYTNKFFSLIKDEHTYDDILKFIYSFLENFKTIINELHKKHHKDLLETVAKHVNKKK